MFLILTAWLSLGYFGVDEGMHMFCYFLVELKYKWKEKDDK